VRIERIGNRLIGYSSSDGEDWDPVGIVDFEGEKLPEEIYLGIVAIGRELMGAQSFQALQAAICDITVSDIPFLRGDCNDDGAIDISDAVSMLNWLFRGGTEPGCMAATNANGDAATDISDAAYLLNHLFLGSSAPVPPFPGCGPGLLPADDQMGCATPPESCR
jgi:hypothetical protein